jgi:signal transduction histidine kinase
MLINGDAGPINEDQKKYLQEVYTGSQRMVDLVNSLLNVSRLDLGTFQIDPVLIDVPKLIKSLLEELKSQIITKKQVVKEIYVDGLHQFSADQNLLRMVLQNLLSNAVKYTPAGGGITTEVKIIDGKFMIKISDTGMGIPKNQQDKVFLKLFRADNAKQSETEGTGLGLYIIKSIVDQAGGSVWFESEENKGTTFYVSFPVTGMRKKEGTRQLDL